MVFKIGILRGWNYRGVKRYYSRDTLRVLADYGQAHPYEIANIMANMERNTENEKHYHRSKEILSRLCHSKTGRFKDLEKKSYITIRKFEPYSRDVVSLTLKGFLAVIYFDILNKELKSNYNFCLYLEEVPATRIGFPVYDINLLQFLNWIKEKVPLKLVIELWFEEVQEQFKGANFDNLSLGQVEYHFYSCFGKIRDLLVKYLQDDGVIKQLKSLEKMKEKTEEWFSQIPEIPN